MRESKKAHIRNKLIIIDLWNGKCVDCGLGITKFNIENLSALTMHHQKPNLKENSLPFFHLLMSNANLERIKSILINEDCICLCSNCHIMVQSTFFNENKEEIFIRYKNKYC